MRNFQCVILSAVAIILKQNQAGVFIYKQHLYGVLLWVQDNILKEEKRAGKKQFIYSV